MCKTEDCTCHKKARFLHHSSILMLSGGHTLHWTYCRNVHGDRLPSGQWTRFTQFTPVKNTPPRGDTWSRGRLTNILSNVQAGEQMARNLVRYVKEISARKKTALGRRGAEARQCTKADRYVLHLPGRQGI